MSRRGSSGGRDTGTSISSRGSSGGTRGRSRSGGQEADRGWQGQTSNAGQSSYWGDGGEHSNNYTQDQVYEAIQESGTYGGGWRDPGGSGVILAGLAQPGKIDDRAARAATNRAIDYRLDNSIANRLAGFFGVRERPAAYSPGDYRNNATWGWEPLNTPAIGLAAGLLNPALGAGYGIAGNAMAGRPAGMVLSAVPGLGTINGLSQGFLGIGADDLLQTRMRDNRPRMEWGGSSEVQDAGGVTRQRRLIDQGMQFGR